MGTLLATPNTDKYNETGEGNGLRYAISSMQGWRGTMEDAHCAITQLPGNLKNWSFFAVFDGHAGALVSATCATELLKCIVDTEEFQNVDPDLAPSLKEIERGIREGFLSLDERLRQLPQLASGTDRSGSTAVCALVTPNHIFFANCGDSRAVLIRDGNVAFQTVDHKPANPAEKERIQNAGGSVIVERVNGCLAVSRSFGDYAYKTTKTLGPTEQLISPEPEITVLDRNQARNEIIVLACDGVWDVLKSDTLCEILKHRMHCTNDLSAVCNDLLDYCLYKGSSDNMSMVLVTFDTAPRADPESQAKDEKNERLLLEKAKDYLDRITDSTDTEKVLLHLQSFVEPDLPPFFLYCKGGKIHKLVEEHNSRHLKAQP